MKIAELKDHLDSLITQNGFLDLVQYADSSNGQVMFAVANTFKGDEDFKAIRSQVHSLISSRDEFTIEYPITYLLFCLELQNLKCLTVVSSVSRSARIWQPNTGLWVTKYLISCNSSTSELESSNITMWMV